MEAESRIAIESDADVVTARQRARELAGELELSSTDQTLLATAISEVARNITTYAIRGEVTLRIVRDGNGRAGIEVVAADHGPGIEDIERALQDGYTTGGGSGSGCRARAGWSTSSRSRAHPAGHHGAARQMVPGRRAGRACVASSPGPPSLERGEAGEPLAGEERSGDLAVWAPYEGGALVAAIDGLGHGGAAADAAEAAADQFRRHAGEPPETLLKRCHEALRSTRGVVATLAWFDLATAGLTWTGIGNVEGRLVRADRDRGDSARLPHPVRRRARLVAAGGQAGADDAGARATAWSWPPTASPRTSARRCCRACRRRSRPGGCWPRTRGGRMTRWWWRFGGSALASVASTGERQRRALEESGCGVPRRQAGRFWPL